MYNNFNGYRYNQNYRLNNYNNLLNNNDERIFGGFLGPFLLGGITGGLVAPLFNNNQGVYYPQPPYYTNNYYYPPYYGPYYY